MLATAFDHVASIVAWRPAALACATSASVRKACKLPTMAPADQFAASVRSATQARSRSLLAAAANTVAQRFLSAAVASAAEAAAMPKALAVISAASACVRFDAGAAVAARVAQQL